MRALIENQHSKETKSPFARLREGTPVVFAIDDIDMQRRVRVPDPRIVITPLPSGELCLALESMGCEIARPEDLQVQWLWKMGLTMRAAEALVSELKRQLLDFRS